jgi:octaprenyl-diphosphate synthase
MTHGTEEERVVIRRAIEEGGLDELDTVRSAIESTGGLEYTARLATQEADAAIAALDSLPDSAHRDALATLARIAVARSD